MAEDLTNVPKAMPLFLFYPEVSHFQRALCDPGTNRVSYRGTESVSHYPSGTRMKPMVIVTGWHQGTLRSLETTRGQGSVKDLNTWERKKKRFLFHFQRWEAESVRNEINFQEYTRNFWQS